MLKHLALTVAMFLTCGAARAAEIAPGKIPGVNRPYGITIDGEIKPGDYRKFRSLLLRLDENALPQEVFLFSPGGDFLESLKIGALIRTLKLTTHAPVDQTVQPVEYSSERNKVCASSCFFILAAGVRRYGDVVGIHRPYLPKSAYAGMSMDDAAASNAKVREIVASYLQEMDVPSEYVERVMAVDSGDVEWLGRRELEKHFQGFAPAYREWIEAQCPGFTKAEDQQYQAAARSSSSAAAATIERLNDKLSESESCRSALQRVETWQAWKKLSRP